MIAAVDRDDGPALAIVVSAEPWVEALHAHLAAHGGARVRQIVLDPRVALEEDYDALIVDARWPSLTRDLVDRLHRLGRTVVGVFACDDGGAQARLATLGVDLAVDAATAPADVVAVLQAVAPSERPSPRAEPVAAQGSLPRGVPRLVAVGGAAGAGVTEVAISFAAAVAQRGDPAVLLDADPRGGSVAPRLGLRLEPNVCGAIDAVAHGDGAGDIQPALVRTRGSRLQVLCGFPSAAAAGPVSAEAVRRLLARLSAAPGYTVADAGAGEHAAVTDAVIGSAPVLVAVGIASPVGVARLVSWLADRRATAGDAALHVVVNRAPSDRYRRREIATELRRAVAPASLVFAPHDRRVEAASWNGQICGAGAFVNALAPLVELVHPRVGRRRSDRLPVLRRRPRPLASAVGG